MLNCYTENLKKIFYFNTLINGLVNLHLYVSKKRISVKSTKLSELFLPTKIITTYLKKYRKFAIVLLILVASISQSFADTWDGTTITAPAAPVGNVYTIATCANLAWVAQQVNTGTSFSGYTLNVTNDLNLNSKAWTPIGYKSTHDKSFQGTFDGGTHIISNVLINIADYGIGLFGDVENTAVIKNVKLQSVNITGTSMVGGLVGIIGFSANSVTIQNCTVTGGSVTSTGQYGANAAYTGGLVGDFVITGAGGATGCSTAVTVNAAYAQDGGLIGLIVGGSITNCYATGNVSGSTYVGGLVGQSYGCNVTGSYATGNVSGSTNVGGFVGFADNWYTIASCFATGNVQGSTSVGGFAGEIYKVTCNSCFATGRVTCTGNNAGGFVGYVDNWSPFTSCYAVGVVSGASYVGGFAGYVNTGDFYTCYAAGSATGSGSNINGFVGYCGNAGLDSSTKPCYFDAQGTGQASSGFAGITSQTTSQLCALSIAGFTNTTGYYPQLTAFYNNANTVINGWSSLSAVPLNLNAADNSANVNNNFMAPLTSSTAASSSLTWGNQSPTGRLLFFNGSLVENINLLTTGTVAFTATDANNYAKTFYIKINTVPPPSINISTTSLTTFTYIYDFGPSIEQTFTINGTSLTSDITLVAPTDFEISITPGTGYQSSIILSRTGSTVNTTTIYVRLKADLALGSYGYITPENITATSGVTIKNLACKGFVTSSNPYIIAGGGISCDNDSIYLTSSGPNIVNQYWTGPNAFYSNIQNPTIYPISAANTGIYTVTGSILSGVNLLVNPGFESGNTGFTTNYTYTTTDLTPEGNYAIIKIPHDLHPTFSSNPPHSGNLQMVVNGKGSTANVWTENIDVKPNTNYQFSYWEQSVSVTSPSQLQLYADGISVGSVYTAPAVLNQWNQYIYNWNSGAKTSVTLSLQNKNLSLGGNDFALDDLDFEPLIEVTSSVNIVVGSQVAGVSIAASVPSIGLGSNVVYTATPTNGGTNPAYQWSVNGVNSGTNSPIFNYVPISSTDVVKCVMTSNKPCATGSPVTSNTVTVTVTGSRNFWMGTSTSTQWLIPTNWTKGIVPAPGDDVEFATDANNGVGNAALNDLVVDVNRTIGNLINQTTNRKLLILPTKILVVNQNITTNGADKIYIQSSSSSSIANGSLIFHNPVSLPVSGTVEMYSMAYKSPDPDLLGYYYKWQFFGIPLRSVVANPTFAGSYIRSWDETKPQSTHWFSLNNSSTLSSFTGYEITQAAAKKVVFQGILENGDLPPVTLIVSPSPAAFPGQHIFANPYTAAIDIKKLTFGTYAEGTVYLFNTGSFGDWNSKKGSFGTARIPGQYLSIPQATAGDILLGIPGQIPSMQAFFVRPNPLLTKPLLDQATFAMTYNNVVIKNTDAQRVKAANDSTSATAIGMRIDLTSTNYSDQMWIYSNPKCTHFFDNGWDGFKMVGNALSPQIYSVESDGNYQVNAVDDMNNTEIAFQAGQDVDYTMTFTHNSITSKYAGVYLMDLVENKTVDVTANGSTYSFVAQTTPTATTRFKIITRNYEKNSPDAETQIKVFNSGSTVFVQNLSSLNGEMIVYDLMGHYLKKAIFGPNAITTFPLSFMTGAYIVNASTSTERVAKRLILND